MIASGSSLASLSTPINLSKLPHDLSNVVVCRAAFDKTFHDAEGYLENKFRGIFLETQALVSEFFLEDYIPLAGWADRHKAFRPYCRGNPLNLCEWEELEAPELAV
ncbi:hypothetical protein Taro_047736 [Colocasia esculenta]|uniref:Uncharacterized protein n=1 Tax=Colocasia esculenta TaxID=4460 RepID=A0A843X5R7_COLES|nr:hypothetical protein [Colocasia esculenta]